MEKAVEYTSRENELMAKAHHECFTSMQKLLVDARADKISANKARRRARRRSHQQRGQNQMMTMHQTMMIQMDTKQQMIIASQRIARWNVTTQKMKVWIHHQRVLTTALQCLATTITTPKTQALCQCGQYM